MDGLMPCPNPWCDGEQFLRWELYGRQVLCTCGVKGPVSESRLPKAQEFQMNMQAKEAWNTRPAPQIKPLDWEHFDAWTWWAKTPSAFYRVNERDGYWRLSAQVQGDEFCPDEMHGNSEAEAKAAAETYHRAMILEALE